MARIIDAITINKKRFQMWVSQYLDLPSEFFANGIIRHEDTIISYMLETGLFTLAELKAVLKQNKIYISERRLKKCLKNGGNEE